MFSIKETLDSLPEQERKRLYFAFEHGLGQHVEIDGRHFIGVNVSTDNFKNLILDHVVGVWSMGRVIKEAS